MYIGIDFGTQRIGIAATEPEGTMALPFSVIPNDTHALDVIVRIAREKQANTIVVGKSLTLAGGENKLQKNIDTFVASLRAQGLHVELHDERFSSAHAARTQGATELLDASAAALILQSFIDTTKK